MKSYPVGAVNGAAGATAQVALAADWVATPSPIVRVELTVGDSSIRLEPSQAKALAALLRVVAKEAQR